MLVLDDWQKSFIETEGDKILVSGRQTGKSEAAAYDNAQYALKYPNKTCLIISKTERQAQELLQKTFNFLFQLSKYDIYMEGPDKPTLSRIRLKNDSEIISLPTGTAGEGIRYLTAHRITVDEAQLVPDEVFAAVTPMLLTTGGYITLLGTPHGKQGFFYKAYENLLKQFKVFHINSEQVMKERPISQDWPEYRREAAIKYLEIEKARMSAKQYAQEYLGQFVEDLNQFFPDELIRKVCILKRPKERVLREGNYGGCDIARLGRDEIVYSVLHSYEHCVHQVENIVKRRQYTTETEQDIIALALAWNIGKFGIDAGSGSLGVGIFDRLMQNPDMKRKVIAMNNRSISLDREGRSQQRIFKEDMYDNLLAMMEKGEILLLDDDEIFASLKSIQYEYNEDSSITRMRIFSSYGHCTEAIVRAAWLAKKEKIYKFEISYF